jgi:hypothetical protein
MTPESKFLDKDNKQNIYYLWKEFGIRKQNKIQSALSLIAQKNLRTTGLDFPSDWSCSVWLKQFGGSFDECRVTVLESIIEPVTPNSRTVKWLFDNEKLDLTEDEIDALTSGFLETPLYKTMVMATKQESLTETSPITEEKTEQPIKAD